jgi:hypothetical protein
MVTLTLKRQGEDTLMTLVHSDLPDHELARARVFTTSPNGLDDVTVIRSTLITLVLISALCAAVAAAT